MINNAQNTSILVLGISGNVSSGILRVLRNNFSTAKIIGACVNDTYFKIYCDEFILSPYASDISFVQWTIDICLKYKVDIIYTGVEEIIYVLSMNRYYIQNESKSILAIPKTEVLEICLSKLNTVIWLRDHNFNHPKFLHTSLKSELIQFFIELGTECILKPISGKGSKDIYKIRHFKDIQELNENQLNLLIAQEYIGTDTEEYTVGCYQLQSGEIMTPIILKRTLNNGNTETAEVVRNSVIEEYCFEITEKLKPFGPINIQLRLNKSNEPVCFEINPRFSGTTLIRDYFGFKDVVSFFNETVNGNFDVNHFRISNMGFCFRRTEEFFFESKESITLKSMEKYET